MKLTLIFLWLCLIQPCYSATNGLPNFAWVNRRLHIARGGQPTPEGFANLRAMGLTNIVKLNLGTDNPAGGTTVRSFPINAWQQFWGGKSLKRKLDAAESAITPFTYVHCSRGENRTGTVIISYRLKTLQRDKWAAISEARRYGWGNSLPGLKAYVKRLR